MNAEEYYNSKAIKHQLKRAIKHDHKYFKDSIIEMLEDYHQSQLKLLGLHGVVRQSEQLNFLINEVVEKERNNIRQWLLDEGYELLSEKI